MIKNEFEEMDSILCWNCGKANPIDVIYCVKCSINISQEYNVVNQARRIIHAV